MPRPLLFLLLFSAASSLAQSAPTHCMTADIQGFPAKTLIGCADPYPDDTLWHLDRLDQRNAAFDGHAWRAHGGKGAVIYVIDSGVFAGHDEFMTATGSRVIAGFDLVPIAINNPCDSPDPVLQPCARGFSELLEFSHGTGSASAAAGKTVGVAPEASVVAIRIVGLTSWTTADIDRALDTVVQHAFDPRSPQFLTGIVNFSLLVSDEGEGITFAMLREKMVRMTTGVDRDGNADPNGKRFFFAVAAGNVAPIACTSGGPPLLFPATIGSSIDGIVTVGGVARSGDAIWSGSCRGELYAPAEQILVATASAHDHYRGQLLGMSGTSWATPMVAGLAARLLDLDPGLTPAQIEARLKASAVPLASGDGMIPLFIPPPPRVRAVQHM